MQEEIATRRTCRTQETKKKMRKMSVSLGSSVNCYISEAAKEEDHTKQGNCNKDAIFQGDNKKEEKSNFRFGKCIVKVRL